MLSLLAKVDGRYWVPKDEETSLEIFCGAPCRSINQLQRVLLSAFLPADATGKGSMPLDLTSFDPEVLVNCLILFPIQSNAHLWFANVASSHRVARVSTATGQLVLY